MLFRAKRIDATKGSIVRSIILYALPLVFSTLIQTLFNAVDVLVLGNMADSVAVASVGATTTIVHLLVNTFVGLASGTKIIMAHQIGARDREGVDKTVGTSLISAIVIGTVIALGGFFLAPLFLTLTNCPTECYDGALIYLRIYVSAAPAIMLYNFGSSVLSSSGDTQRPMYYIFFCGLLNVILNVILCLILPQKVAAVAIATAAAQILGAFFVMHRLCTMEGIGHVTLSKMKWHAHSFGRMMRYGVPIALSNALYPLANLQIQSAINSFGPSAIAGNSAASTVEGFSSAFNGAMGTTTTTFMGQNLGAKKPDRVKKTFIRCILMAVSSALVMGIFIYLTGRFWLGLILPDDRLAVDYGMIRMFFITLFVFISASNSVLSHALQAFGVSIFSAVNSIVSIFGFRMIWMTFIYPRFQTFECLMACFLVSWCFMLLCNITVFSFIYRQYKRNRLRNVE